MLPVTATVVVPTLLVVPLRVESSPKVTVTLLEKAPTDCPLDSVAIRLVVPPLVRPEMLLSESALEALLVLNIATRNPAALVTYNVFVLVSTPV